MYVSIESEGIGLVENGVVTELYEKDSTISEIESGDANTISSDIVGTQVQASRLVHLISLQNSYIAKLHLGKTIRNINSDDSIMDLHFKEWI